jgi:hypothetical protein
MALVLAMPKNQPAFRAESLDVRQKSFHGGCREDGGFKLIRAFRAFRGHFLSSPAY